MEMTDARWKYTNNYLAEVFGTDDEVLNQLMPRAVSAGIPSIAVNAEVGRLLNFLVKTTRGKTALELGTLAGYSGIWVARALADGGVLHTVELDDKHADFAEARFKEADVDARVNVVRGAALDVIDDLAAAHGPFDFIFVDAVKTEYPSYWQKLRAHVAEGGLFVADNVLGANYWIDDEGHPSREAVHQLNQTLAADDAFDVCCVPLREGLTIARRKEGTR